MPVYVINTVVKKPPPPARLFYRWIGYEPGGAGASGLRQVCGRGRVSCQTGPSLTARCSFIQDVVSPTADGSGVGRYLLDRLYLQYGVSLTTVRGVPIILTCPVFLETDKHVQFLEIFRSHPPSGNQRFRLGDPPDRKFYRT